MWYLVPVYVSFLLPKALLKHSSRGHSNQIIESIPLGIKVFGGIGFSVGFTNSWAFLLSISRSVGSKSAGSWYPERAFSKSIAWLKFVGKSSKIQPLFSKTLMF